MATIEGMSGEARTCASPGCGIVFVPQRKTQMYHSAKCGKRTRNAARFGLKPGEHKDKVTLEAAVLLNQEDDKALTDALEAARQRDVEQANRQELKKATALESRIRRYEAVLDATLRAYEPTPLVVPAGNKDSLPEHEMILATGDWHTGATVKVHETGGVYEQDVATTRGQVFKLWDRIQRLHSIQSQGIYVKKLHIISLGDLIDNDDMRPSQHRHVEDVMTVQTVQAFDLLTWLIRQTLQIVPEVEVDLVGGNHDRTGRAKGNAGLGELDYADTMSWVIGEFTKRLFADEPRVKVRNWNTFFGYKLVAGQKVVFEHGSSIKWNAGSYGGVPWYGVSQLPAKYASMLGAADITIMGHGHRPAILPDGRGWLVLNGALPATSGYEQSSFKSVRRPLQWLMSVHEEHGLVGWQPIYLDVEGTVLPGTVWDDPEHYAELANDRSGSVGI